MNAFVILHYRAIKSTIACVDSIKALDGDNFIVIVDNGSPDDTGEQLMKKYADDAGVKVILSEKNLGFARGNNIGVRWAVDELDPDFTVVLNDDVEVLQKNFCTRISEIYDETPFDLLGPDILSVFSGIHQSPKRMKGFDLESTKKKLEYVKRSQNPILMLLSSGEKNSPAIWRIAQRRARAKQNIDSSVRHENVVLHGACIIFSKRYTDKHPEPFYPGTFMYFELEILEWLCRQEGAYTLYDPSISVTHYQYVSTKMQYRNIVKRSKFVARCLEDSLHAAIALMEGSEK